MTFKILLQTQILSKDQNSLVFLGRSLITIHQHQVQSKCSTVSLLIYCQQILSELFLGGKHFIPTNYPESI